MSAHFFCRHRIPNSWDEPIIETTYNDIIKQKRSSFNIFISIAIFWDRALSQKNLSFRVRNSRRNSRSCEFLFSWLQSECIQIPVLYPHCGNAMAMYGKANGKVWQGLLEIL